MEQLHFPKPPELRIFLSSFNRPNLHYEVRFKPCSDIDLYQNLSAFLKNIYEKRKKRLGTDTSLRIDGVCGIMQVDLI
jgi:superfamily II DNA helicase RecQ